MTVGHGVFILIVVLALSFFSYNAQRLIRYMMSIGQPEVRTDDPLTRIRNLFLTGLAQKKILRDAVAGPLHASVFWGFVVLTIGTAEIIIQGLVPGFTYAAILPAPIYSLFILSQELFALLVLAAVGVLLYRRIVVKPKRLQGDRVHSGDAILILSMIGALMVSLISLGAFDFALHPDSGTMLQPVSLAVSHLFTGLSVGTLETGRATSWWFHALLILVFLNYLPYSKHLHVLTSLPNTYLSNTSGPGVIGAMSYMDLEAEGVEHFGASDVTQLGWKSLLDSYSCTECGRCTAVCPANITGKMLSPRKIMINTRQRLMELAPLASGGFGEFEHHVLVAGDAEPAVTAVLANTLLDNYITEDELWACTSCRACVQECPVSIDQLDIINELRRDLVLMESRFPPEIQPAFESLERNGSPWAFDPGDRAKWAEGMDIPTMAEMVERGERPEVLFWVGCMGSFDDRAKKIAVAFARVLQAAKVKFAILGQEEKCNGDPARRMGNEYLYQMLARDNIETLDRYGVQTIVTNCPHCFHQIGNEYPQLGGNYDVIHHSTYIEKLLEENRLPLNGEGKQLTIAYHDSCYLGRYNDVYDAPRETLRRALPMINLVEPPRTRSRALCCGAGGGRMWMEETVGKRINAERTEELLATGADVLAVACPFCMTMIGDGAKGQDSSVPVLDISEVVAQQLAR